MLPKSAAGALNAMFWISVLVSLGSANALEVLALQEEQLNFKLSSSNLNNLLDAAA